MCVYNRGNQFIIDAIKSVLNQTYKNFEFIIVDDGSTDNTKNIIRSFDDKRIKLIENTHNGIAVSRQICLENCNGKYIAILDSDDMMYPNRLEHQYAFMEANPDVDILSCSMDYIDNNGNITGGFDADNEIVDAERLSKNNCISNSTSFMRLSSIKDAHLHYKKDFDFCEDYRFFADAVIAELRLRTIPFKASKYRIHSSNSTKSHTYTQITLAEIIKNDLKRFLNKKAYFITFSNSTSDFSFDRIRYEAENMKSFTGIDCYTEKGFDKEYWDKYKDHFNGTRGYGYWSWKPYFIKKKLSEMNDGDILVYADTGCMFLKDNVNELRKWFGIAYNSPSGILSPCYGPYLEHEWTRYDLYDYINKTYNHNNVDIFDKAIQCGAGILIVCKNKQSVDFINQWNDVMSEHFHLCTDEPSSLPNHPNFHENRHDQSVFSMLSKIYNIETINTSDGIINKHKSPIICTRCKNDKFTWIKPVKVLFDSQTYDLQTFGGISRMYVELHKVLDRNEIVDNFTGSGIAHGKYNEIDSSFAVLNTNNIYLKKLKPYNVNKKGNNRQYTIELLNKGDFDVFYPTFFDPYFIPYLNGKPFVMSIHDMIPELYPQFFSSNDMQIVGKRIMAKQAAAIEVPTETTKKDVMRILGVDENKIHVIGRGYDKDFGKNITQERIFNFKYILYVGQRNAYKRFDWFIKFASEFLKEHNDIKLVCTGADFNDNEMHMFNTYGISNQIIHIYANDDDLAKLYRDALCFVYSSEYEGFGMPILEAYQMNCIALLNKDNKCFKEVTDNKGVFFQMNENSSDISSILNDVINLTDEKKIYILNRQKDILTKYSWKNSADKLSKIFQEVNKQYNLVSDSDSNKDVDIFICAHKNFSVYPNNNVYKIVHGKEKIDVPLEQIEESNTDISPMQFSFAEGSRMYYLWKNYDFKKYVGFCHYRKYFNFFGSVPEINKLFQKYDVILTQPIKCGSIPSEYGYYHNINDLISVKKIIQNKYSDYYDAFMKACFSGIMFPCNMFIMKSDDFKEYCSFVFGVLKEFVNEKGFKTDDDIKKYVEKHSSEYLKNFYPNNTIEYQSRMCGYLLERLTNAYIFYKFKTPLCYQIVETEKKYT